MPDTEDVRPTKDRIKESMFEILNEWIPGTDILELFAGSGSLGIEALSRGARSVVFVDRQLKCVETIKENLDSLKIKNYKTHISSARPQVMEPDINPAIVMQGDVFKALKFFSENHNKFGMIIADPPYGVDNARKLLIKLDTYDIINQPFLIVIEHSEKDNIPQIEGNIILLKQYNYGETILSIYRKKK